MPLQENEGSSLFQYRQSKYQKPKISPLPSWNSEPGQEILKGANLINHKSQKISKKLASIGEVGSRGSCDEDEDSDNWGSDVQVPMFRAYIGKPLDVDCQRRFSCPLKLSIGFKKLKRSDE